MLVALWAGSGTFPISARVRHTASGGAASAIESARRATLAVCRFPHPNPLDILGGDCVLLIHTRLNVYVQASNECLPFVVLVVVVNVGALMIN